MGRFYASIQGNRGEATRMGTPTSGIRGHIRGWNAGCRVEVGPKRVNGEPTEMDVVLVYATAGSNGGAADKLIARIEEKGYGREPEITIFK